MATATMGSQFPCHGVATSGAHSGDLLITAGYDPQYGNFYGQGIPFMIPASVAGTVPSISVTFTMKTYGADYSTGKKYYIWISDTQYKSTSSTTKYNSIKGNSDTSFTTTHQGSSGAKSYTITVTKSLTPGKQYYLYFHYGTSTNSSLYEFSGISVSYTRYSVTYNANGYGTAPGTQYKATGGSVTIASYISPGTTLVKQDSWNTKADGSGTKYTAGQTYSSNANLTLYAIWVPNGLVRIYDGSSWRQAIPYVYDGSKWRQAIPYVYNGSAWKQGG